MTFDIIGTGNTAWFMGMRLTAAGHTCTGVYGRRPEHAAALATALGTRTYHNLHYIPGTNDCCIIAISDYAIAEVAAQLHFTDTVLAHTAGAVDMEVLAGAAVHRGVLWPVYSILKTDLPQHRNIPLVWEAGTAQAANVVLQLAGGISDIVYEADSEKRKWLHLSAVLSNNFTNHLYSICEELCKTHDVPFHILYPIICQTSERIINQSPAALQTGPARRGDTGTLHRHMDMLSSNPLWQEVYKSVSASIENMYSANAGEKDTKR